MNMLKRVFFTWATAILVLWCAVSLVAPTGFQFTPRPLLAFPQAEIAGRARIAGVAQFGGTASAGITYDASSQGSVTGGNSISWTHVTGAGPHRALYISLYAQASLAAATCTYNGVTTTFLLDQVDGISLFHTAAFILPNPASGSNTVSCSVSSSGGFLIGQATSWTGVNQTIPNRTAIGANTPTGSTTNIVVSNAVSGDMVVDTVVVYSASVITPGGTQTQRFEQTNVASNSTTIGSSSKSAAGSTTMQWAGTFSYWAEIGVALIAG
jgi:hypothetical protein